MLRVYLAGEVSIENGNRVLRDREFPSRQVRNAFVYLALERARSIGREELSDALWSDIDAPISRDVSLSAVLSKLRLVLRNVAFEQRDVVVASGGCYQLRLPVSSWVDLEQAMASLHEAEGALLASEPARAYTQAVIATSILRRPFLAGGEAVWMLRRQASLRSARLRALEAMIQCLQWNGEFALALKNAEELIELAPLRETGYCHLMRLHSLAGNRAEALNAYHRCREVLSDEVGVEPSKQTEAVYLAVLGDA